MGTAPLAMTTRVCSEVPDAMFVSAQADSNWRSGWSENCARGGGWAEGARRGGAEGRAPGERGRAGVTERVGGALSGTRLQELHEARDDARGDDLLNGR